MLDVAVPLISAYLMLGLFERNVEVCVRVDQINSTEKMYLGVYPAKVV